MFTNDDVIHSYTRKEALEDRVLIAAGPLARELGFKHPVALTAAAWAECVQVPEGVGDQDERGRLWDVLWLMHLAARKAPPGTREVRFDVRVQGRGRWPVRVSLRAVCGPDDDGSPCVTVMLASED